MLNVMCTIEASGIERLIKNIIPFYRACNRLSLTEKLLKDTVNKTLNR